jgi:transposase
LNGNDVFAKTLKIESPWCIENFEFLINAKGAEELHIYVGFIAGTQFLDDSNQLCAVHDRAEERVWQHVNHFEYKTFIHCRLPRIRRSDGKVRTIESPWARPSNGFTLLLEAFVMKLLEKEVAMTQIASLLNVHDNRLWRVFSYWVQGAIKNTSCKDIAYLGIDETSAKKVHKYVSIAVDLENSQVIHVTVGKDKEVLKSVANHLEVQGVNLARIEEISMDLSPAFIAGASENFPNTPITFDRFHVTKLLNEGVNQVRQSEQKEHDFFKRTKYIFLKNRNNLTSEQEIKLNEAIVRFPNIGAAYRLKVLFNEFWSLTDHKEAEVFLEDWVQQANESKIVPMQAFAKTVKRHWKGILRYTTSRISNGILEGLNSKIQLAKRRARGFRNINNFIQMIYFVAGKLNFTHPTYP